MSKRPFNLLSGTKDLLTSQFPGFSHNHPALLTCNRPLVVSSNALVLGAMGGLAVAGITGNRTIIS